MLRACDNPFSTDRVLRERYRFDESDWTRLRERLASRNGRGSLVGPKGSGKTTLLEDLGNRLTHEGYRVILIRLSADHRCIPQEFSPEVFTRFDHCNAILLDGAEQLSLLRWWSFRWQTRHAGLVVVTTHRAGRLPTLHRCTTSPDLLCDLVVSLGLELSEVEAHRLYRAHRGNIREALRELYDQHAVSLPL